MRRPIRLVPMLVTSLALAGALVVAGPAAPALAGTINVTTQTDQYGTDPANCSLREAMHSANIGGAFGGCSGATTGPDTIALPAGTYALTIPGTGENDNVTGDIDVASDVTLDPSGVVTIDGTTIDRVLHVGPGGILSASELTITRGRILTASGGAIIVEAGGTLTLTGVTLTDNEAQDGGALSNDGTATLANVTISGNRATRHGGGVHQGAGTATLNNVTVANNTADSNGDDVGDGGGVHVTGGTLNLANTILGDNTDGSTPANLKHPDCSGTVTSQGYNLIEDTTGCVIAGVATGNITGTDPRLSALANNGGPTPTHLPRRNSPVIDAGNPAPPGSGPAACAATDQRGVPRPQGPRCDIGSVEVEVAGPGGPVCLGVPVTISGTGAGETLTGTNRADSISARGGNDLILARRGRDTVCAGAGRDVAKGEEGPDRIAGQGDNDRGVGGPGRDRVNGNAGRDRLRGKGGNDTLRGGKGADLLDGGAGFDICRGGPGRDRFRRCEVRA
jgi:Ca2+-binding RTX toxin-like protein